MAEMESLDLVQAGDIYLATYKYRDNIYIQVEKGRGLQLVYLYRFGSDMKHCIFRLHNEAELEDSYLLGFVSDDIDESIEDLESLDT